jgi:hypothetical protein
MAVLLRAVVKLRVLLGTQVIARVRGYADAAQAPEWFTTAPSLAIPKVTPATSSVVASVLDVCSCRCPLPDRSVVLCDILVIWRNVSRFPESLYRIHGFYNFYFIPVSLNYLPNCSHSPGSEACRSAAF